jgi:hypothetical protein
MWVVLILFAFLMFLLVPFGASENVEEDEKFFEEMLLLLDEEDEITDG